MDPPAPVDGRVQHPESDVVGAGGLEHATDVTRRAEQVEELFVDRLRLLLRVAGQEVEHLALAVTV